MTNNTSIQVTYSDTRLRTLVEEYITLQKHEFTFKGLCSYVLYWAREEGKTDTKGVYVSDRIDAADGERLREILRKIIGEGRIACEVVVIADDTMFVKTKE